MGREGASCRGAPVKFTQRIQMLNHHPQRSTMFHVLVLLDHVRNKNSGFALRV